MNLDEGSWKEHMEDCLCRTQLLAGEHYLFYDKNQELVIPVRLLKVTKHLLEAGKYVNTFDFAVDQLMVKRWDIPPRFEAFEVSYMHSWFCKRLV
jgi:hypothetical protein